MAYSARLNDREAFPDLSLFDDETLSTGPEGRLAPRAGQTAISLGGSTVATLHLVADGTHVDLARGVVFFKVPAGTLVEVHAEGAFLRAKNARGVQAEIKILGPKALQVTPRRGNPEFLYREERRVLREGEPIASALIALRALRRKRHLEHKQREFPAGNGPESPAKP